MRAELRQLVAARAGGRCEFCRIAQEHVPYVRFWIEHLTARQHGGGDELDNLGFSCPWCNRRKGPNLSAIDPASGAVVLLFNPRTQDWDEHFRVVDHTVMGLSPEGRATIALLGLNDERRLGLRRLASSVSE